MRELPDVPVATEPLEAAPVVRDIAAELAARLQRAVLHTRGRQGLPEAVLDGATYRLPLLEVYTACQEAGRSLADVLDGGRRHWPADAPGYVETAAHMLGVIVAHREAMQWPLREAARRVRCKVWRLEIIEATVDVDVATMVRVARAYKLDPMRLLPAAFADAETESMPDLAFGRFAGPNLVPGSEAIDTGPEHSTDACPPKYRRRKRFAWWAERMREERADAVTSVRRGAARRQFVVKRLKLGW